MKDVSDYFLKWQIEAGVDEAGAQTSKPTWPPEDCGGLHNTAMKVIADIDYVLAP